MEDRKNYFIDIGGVCKDCHYPVICESGERAGQWNDWYYYCSNPDCKNHEGKCCCDEEEDLIDFCEFINCNSKDEINKVFRAAINKEAK